VGSWSTQFWGPESYVYGYGTTARYAMLDAIDRIDCGDVFERLSGMTNAAPRKHESADVLIAALNIPQPKPEARRKTT
jgi:hypothetical protein